MVRTSKWAALAGVAMVALSFAATIETADARPRGRSGHAAVQTQRGTFQGASEVSRARGERQRQATVTGPNGAQRSVNDERRWSREDGTYSHDRDVTGANGATRSVDTDVQRTAPGEYTAQREVTGRNGETRMQTGDFAVTQTENGRSVNGDITTSNAGQVDYNRDVSRQDGARSVNSSAAFEDGTSINRSSTASCADHTCTASGAVTNRQGETTSWEQSRTRDGNDVTYARDTTFADGSTRSVDRTRDGNGDGTGTVDRTVTGRDGETRTQTGTYEVTRP